MSASKLPTRARLISAAAAPWATVFTAASSIIVSLVPLPLASSIAPSMTRWMPYASSAALHNPPRARPPFSRAISDRRAHSPYP